MSAKANPQLLKELPTAYGPFGTVEIHVSFVEELKKIAELNGKSLREVAKEAVSQYLDRES